MKKKNCKEEKQSEPIKYGILLGVQDHSLWKNKEQWKGRGKWSVYPLCCVMVATQTSWHFVS